MLRSVSILKKNALMSIGLLTLILFPLSGTTFADDVTPCAAPAHSTYAAGVHWPNGTDASTFTYQCSGQYAGMWTNAHYLYNPATGAETALDPAIYTYNSATGLWDTTTWVYITTTSSYQAETASVTTPPAGATTVGGPVAKPPVTSTTGSTTPATTQAGSSGSNSTNPTHISGNGTNNNTTLNNTTGASMNNGVLSLAGSGNASVIGNTTGGSALTGTANAMATIINTLQSSSGSLGDPSLMSFTANINGDVNGDLLLDPSMFSNVQPADDTTNLNNNVTVNNSTDASINNTVNLGATSGDAAVEQNTSAGDATSGNATAVANIVNVLNSAVNAGKSFVGVININGNLNGDILLPPNFVDTLLASNVPRYTVDSATLNTTANVTNTTNQSINNTIAATAASGNAAVNNNTAAGDATSGKATTNLTIFNLTGSNVVASNDLLVFVNVLGSWYGMIMNTSAGTTAASLGGGVSSNTNVTNDATLANTNDQTINNNIHVQATSGDATVANNTKAGNATSGDASSSVNLANLINDKLSLTGWFGLLFINVFGSWNGSFGINTSAGDPIATPSAATGSSTGDITPTQAFQFIPKTTTYNGTGATYTSNGSTTVDSSVDAAPTSISKTAVLAAKTIKSAVKVPTLANTAHTSYLLPIIGGGLALLILIASERNRFVRRS